MMPSVTVWGRVETVLFKGCQQHQKSVKIFLKECDDVILFSYIDAKFNNMERPAC
jgi:hypothetical protein